MTFNKTAAHHRTVGSVMGGLLVAGAIATMFAPAAAAAPDCSASGVASTVSATTSAAHDYLNAHPGADQVVSAAYHEPRPQAAADVRSYFTANPQEYDQLRAILAPIGDTQRQCNVTVLSPELASAYDEFMAG